MATAAERWNGLHPRTIALGLGLVAVAAYALTIGHGFVYDDKKAVLTNDVIFGKVPLFEAFSRDFWGRTGETSVGTYRPLAVLSLALDRVIGGGAGWAFHLGNVVVHGLVVALAFRLFEPLAGRTRAVLAMALFAVLAAPSEAIEAIVGRADLLAALFLVIGVAMHRRKGPRGALFATLAYAGALLTKESSLVAPVLFWAFAFVSGDRHERARLGRWVSYAAVAAGVVALRAHALGGVDARVIHARANPLIQSDFVHRVFGAGHIFLERYVAGFIDPSRRLCDCSAWACGPSSPADPVAWAGLLLLAALCLAPLMLFRRSPLVALGLAWAAVLFVPVSNVLVLAPTLYGERLLYAPALGLCLAIAVGIKAFSVTYPRPATALFGVLFAGNLLSLEVRHGDWSSEEALYFSAAELAPDDAKMQANLAATRLEDRRFEDAERLAARAISIWPDDAFSHDVRGVALDGLGRGPEAEGEFREALRHPYEDLVVLDYATYLAKHERLWDARQLLTAHLAKRPADANAQALLVRIELDLAGSR